MSDSLESTFAHRVVDEGVLIARQDRLVSLCAEGLDRLAAWSDRTGADAASADDPDRLPGRGETAVVESASGAIRLKQLRRGGLLAPLWRHRFVGSSRLLANLEIPLIAAQRNVPTPAAVALFLVPGPPAFYRGWLATEEIEGAIDLWRLLRDAAGSAAGRAASAQAMQACDAAIRKMHEAGLDHPDLNIGNLLVRGADAFVIDLDKASLDDRPIPAARRAASRARLERSYVKHLQPAPDALDRFRQALGSD